MPCQKGREKMKLFSLWPPIQIRHLNWVRACVRRIYRCCHMQIRIHTTLTNNKLVISFMRLGNSSYQTQIFRPGPLLLPPSTSHLFFFPAFFPSHCTTSIFIENFCGTHKISLSDSMDTNTKKIKSISVDCWVRVRVCYDFFGLNWEISSKWKHAN